MWNFGAEDSNHWRMVTIIAGLELLHDRYGQPHMVIDAYMRALWELKRPSAELRSLRSFYDKLESYIRVLRLSLPIHIQYQIYQIV